MGEKTVFATRVRERREELDMSQAKLAQAANITPQTLSAYEKAEEDMKGKNPSLENAVAIAKSLGVSLDWLCGRSDDMNMGRPHTYGQLIRTLLPLCEGYDSYIELTKTISESGEPCTVLLIKDKSLIDFFDRWKKFGIISKEDLGAEVFTLWYKSKMEDYDQLLLYPKGCEPFPDEDDEMPSEEGEKA